MRSPLPAIVLLLVSGACIADETKVAPPRPRWVERCLELERQEDPDDEPRHFRAIHSSTTISCEPAPGTATPLLTSGRMGISGWGRNRSVGAPVEVFIGERRGTGRQWDRLYAAVVFRGPPAMEETQGTEDQEEDGEEPAGQESTSESNDGEVEKRDYLAIIYMHSGGESRVIATFPVPFTDFMSSYEFNLYRIHAVRTWFERWPLIVLTADRGGQGGGGTTFVYRVSESDRRITCIAEITDGYGGTMAWPIRRATIDFSDLTSGSLRRFTVYEHELLQGRHEQCARTTYTWQGGGYRPDRVVVSLRTVEDWYKPRALPANGGVGMSATPPASPDPRPDQPVGGQGGEPP